MKNLIVRKNLYAPIKPTAIELKTEAQTTFEMFDGLRKHNYRIQLLILR